MARLSLLDRFRQSRDPQRSITSLDDYAQALNQWVWNGHLYQTPLTTYGTNTTETVAAEFPGYAALFERHPVLFACIETRALVFSEARFQWRQLTNGRPGDLFGTSALQPLENPWPNGTTGELLARLEQDASLAGNAYMLFRDGQARRLRPDHVTIVRGGDDERTAELVGYAYRTEPPDTPEILPVEQVVHYSPIPDPVAQYKGMSWVRPLIRELTAHSAATSHKLKFFENGATPNLVVSLDSSIGKDEFSDFVDKMDATHKGVANAYKTLYLGGGADATVVGANFKDMTFTAMQGASETLVAAAAGVPPVLVGLSEGLQAATYSNYAQARRRFVDGTIRPLWRMVAASLERVLSKPSGAHLWYDDRDIPFLREDLKDEAEIESIKAGTIRQLIDAGFEPDDIVAAVQSTDLGKLAGKHTGMSSVQLQPPATSDSTDQET